VDKGYRGDDQPKNRVFKSGQRRSVHVTIKKELRRRSVIEPIMGHLKSVTINAATTSKVNTVTRSTPYLVPVITSVCH